MAEILVGTSGLLIRRLARCILPAAVENGDMLEYYAREFRYTEVNSTYYALPSQQSH